MEAAAASAMDFHALSRRELQALCKRNGVRANMTNAAMAEALQGLTSVDGIDEIGSTLCLPTPGRSTMKSAAKAASLAGEEQQQGSPLPRGRRVSVMSPAAIRMDVEEGGDEVKRDLVKEVVKTPGVALRSTSRRARATPAPLPTPTTLRRSQRTAARKAAAPVEAENRAEEVPTVQRTTRRASARSKMMMELDQEEEAPAAAPEEKAQEQKAYASDVKCDDLEEEEEVTKVLDGSNKEEEPEEGEEADSSDAANGSELVSVKSCNDLKVEEVAGVVDQEVTKLQERTVEEQEPISVEKCAPLAPVEDSPILGVLSKAEATESIVEKAQDATVEDDEAVDEMTDEVDPVNEMTDEIIPVNEMIDEVNPVSENKTVDVTKKEGEKEGAADEMPQAKLIEDEISEDDELDEDEEWTSDDDEEGDFTDGSDDENDETDEERDCTEVNTDLNQEKKLVQKLQETVIAGETSEDGSDEMASEGGSDEEASEGGSDEEASEGGSDEDDDFSGDLPPEFDNVVVLTDAETDSDTTLPALDEHQATFASATRSAVKSLDDSVISEGQEVSSEESVPEEADINEEAMQEVDNTVDTIVKSLDEFTIKEATQEAELQKQQFEDLHSKSLRQLKTMYKDALKAKVGKQQVSAEGGKRLPLAEVDDNAGVNC